MQDYITLLAQSGATIAETIRKAVFPAYHMGIAAAEGNAGSFFIFLACAVIPFAIVFFAISRNFAAGICIGLILGTLIGVIFDISDRKKRRREKKKNCSD